MSRFKTTTDFYWTAEGDFSFDADKEDLEDTSLYQYRGMLQRIDTHVRSSQGDWRLQNQLGAGIQSVVGKRNTPENAAIIANRIENSLINASLLRAGELKIDTFPLSEHLVAVILLVSPAGVSNAQFLTYTYDLRHNRLVPRNL